MKLIIVLLLVISPFASSSAQESTQQAKSAEALFNRGNEYLQARSYVEAIEQFEKAISLKPGWAEAYLKLGVAHSWFADKSNDKQAHIEAAMKAFKTAIKLKPEFVEAYEQLGIAYLYQGRFEDGIKVLKDAIRIKPDFASAHKLIGLGYLALDNREQAMQAYHVLKPLNAEMASFLLSCIQRPEKFVFGVRQGQRLSTPQPPYPDVARKNKISGNVRVHVLIDEQGNVISAKAVSGPLELRPAAEAAALKARFSPTLLSGMPVKVNGAIDYNFVPR